jgi:two-component system NtrC family sensor kinase
MAPTAPTRRPHRSLRTILIVWFLLFSLTPLVFVTGYSVKKYEVAIDNELSQRLAGNAREINAILSDFRNSLAQKRDRYIKDNGLIYHLSTNEAGAVKNLAGSWLKSDFASSLTFFHRDGRMLVSVFKDQNGNLRDFVPQGNAPIYLSDQNLDKLKGVKEYAFIEFSTNQKLSLILFSKVFGSGGRHVGYLEQLIDLDQTFLTRLKQRMKLELILIKPSGQVVVATHPDFYLYKKDFFQDYTKDEKKPFFELNLRSNPYGFLVYPMSWGQSDLYLALGASKVEAKAVLRNVNYAFYTVVGAVIILLIITIVLTSNTILKPLNELVAALGNIQSDDKPIEIPIKSDTEIGLLTESFNQMSRHVAQARKELKKKISELELANQELKETQSRLVHSSKMVSLGQLVAGVAHELNNPIGFIYSNMSHLRDYANKLIHLAEIAETNPSEIAATKAEMDLAYIKEDLPKLIASCEEGARRTKDIVLGLRNFSRLEEAKLKDVDIHESIDNTLNLLSGEIKNRIQVVRDYGKIPLVNCFASEINQVFMNILSNAVQAIEGPGNLWISTKPIQKPDGTEMVQISFQDSGKGMTAQTMEKIFDPFFSTKGVGQGTGLGLSISYGIIQSHGGEIFVKSQVGIGTEFLVQIPIQPPPEVSLKKRP